jgi:serine phosphatase RsbU (regulator of sigma subunit)
MQYSCAGHPFPLIRRASGEVVELGKGSLPLGINPQLEVPVQETSLQSGDTLVLFTDGLPEAVGGKQGEAFGFDRLRGLVQEAGSPRQVHDRVLGAFDYHTGHEPLTDDLTLVVVARR